MQTIPSAAFWRHSVPFQEYGPSLITKAGADKTFPCFSCSKHVKSCLLYTSLVEENPAIEYYIVEYEIESNEYQGCKDCYDGLAAIVKKY